MEALQSRILVLEEQVKFLSEALHLKLPSSTTRTNLQEPIIVDAFVDPAELVPWTSIIKDHFPKGTLTLMPKKDKDMILEGAEVYSLQRI
jgi:hypothetical protein